MSNTIEQLELEVQSSATSAVSGIDALASSLDKLKSAVKGGVGLTAVAKQLTTLNTALNGVSGANADNLNKLAQGLQTLSSIGNLKLSPSVATQITNIGNAVKSLTGTDSSVLRDLASALTPLASIGKANLNSFISQLQRLPQAVQALNSVSIGSLSSQIRELISALTPLTQMGKNNLASFVNQLKKLPEAVAALQSVNIGALASQIQQLANAFAPLATQMQSIANGFSALPTRLQRLIQQTNKLSAANSKASMSYVNLAAKIGIMVVTIKRVVSVIAGWITKSNEYVESLNLFTVSLGEYATEAQKYAENVAEIMGIDPAEWLRNQGVFMTLATGFGVVNDRAYTMSKNLTQLGYDLSSFFNISYEDAFQKLQSGISGELEPLRRLGYDLSVARLQQEALNLGITKSVNAMTQAEKAELRYYAIMTQVTTAQGDMARTLEAPANQLRILKAQVNQAARALGNIFIPMLNAVLPYAIALAKVIRLVADAIASLFGFALPEIDYSGLDSVVDDSGKIDDNLGGAADEAKKVKNALLGIDELNIISPEDNSSGGSGSGAGGGAGGLGFELPTYDFIGDVVNAEIEKLTEKIKDLLLLIGAVGAAFATWGLVNWIAKLMGLTDVVKALTMGDYLSVLAGLLLTVGGAVLYLSGACDALKNGMNWKNLLKMLGGIASAATGVYLILKPFSTTIAPIAAGAVAAAGGLGLLAISLGDIEKNGANVVNVIGSVGGLAAAVVGLNLAFKNSKLAIAPLIAPLAAFAGSLGIVKSTVTDIILNGASAENVLGAIVGVVGAITAAVYLWNAACAINPILGIAMIVIGIISAIKGIADAVSAAGEEAYQASEDYQVMENILSRCADTSERCTAAIDNMNTEIENLDTTSYDFATASHLLDEIFAINDNVNATNYDLQLMAVKVDILNGLGIEGLTLSIDETTGRVIEARQEVENLIASLEQEARMEAVRDLLVQSYKDQYVAMADAEQALKDYDAASIALNDTAEKLANCPWYNFKLHSELTAAQKEQTEAVEAAQQAYAQAMDTYDALGGTIETYTDNLVGMKLEEAGIGDDMIEGLDAVQSSLQDTADNMPGYGADIANGLRNGVSDNVKENEYKTVWQKIGDWFKDLFGIHSPSTVFNGYGVDLTDGLLNGVKGYTSMKSTVEEWSSKVKEWFTKGEDGKGIVENFKQFGTDIVTGFKDKIGSTSPSSKTNMTSWATNVKNWFTGNSFGGVNKTSFSTFANDTIEGFKNKISTSYVNTRSSISTWASDIKTRFNSSSYGGVNSSTFSTYAGDVITGFKNKIGNSYTDSRSNMQTFGSNVKSWFKSYASYDSFYSIASDVIDGFKNGIGNLYSTCKNMIKSWGSDIIDWFKGVLGINSPSKVFYEMAGFSVEGFNNGFSFLGKSTKGVVSSWADSFTAVTPTMSFAVDTSALKYYDSGSFAKSVSANVTSNTSVTATGFMEGMEEFYREYVEPTMAQMAADMRRQADKQEQTIVQIGNRTISDAVTTQQKANGFVFAK